jgi:hypothetical protein
MEEEWDLGLAFEFQSDQTRKSRDRVAVENYATRLTSEDEYCSNPHLDQRQF